MIDGRGQARITDFGLAGLEKSIDPRDLRSGTPGYMAPEIMEDREVSVRSDVYALGATLYELLTGERAFTASTSMELARMQRESRPATPSTHVSGLDPAVERVVLRCLEQDPGDRPASALAVAAALPGGDPLAAALAAGETPSPQMVANAGTPGALRPLAAVCWLALALAGVLALPWFHGVRTVVGQLRLDMPPAELALVARDTIHEAGYTAPPLDRAYGFDYDSHYFQNEQSRPPRERWRAIREARPSPVKFWYRESPRFLIPGFISSVPSVSPGDPTPTVSGMVAVELDSEGRLLRFEAVPPERDESVDGADEPDWSGLFARAGLDEDVFTPTRPIWTSLVATDLRRAWTGPYPDRPELETRVEAGAYRGRATVFRLIVPWTRASRMEVRPWGPGERAAAVVLLSLLVLLIVAGVLLARRNLRMGRGDRQGAFRLALVVFALTLGRAFMLGPPRPALAVLVPVFQGLAWSLLFAGICWVLYVALEPYVRRLWPHAIISWSRAFQGRFRDPMVGRDLLAGLAIGFVAAGLISGVRVLAVMLDLPWSAPDRGGLALVGVRQVLATYFASAFNGLANTVLFLFLLLLLQVVLRRRWLAVAALLAIFLGLAAAGMANPLEPLMSLFFVGAIVLSLRWFGMLATVFTNVAVNAPFLFAFTTDSGSWYAAQSAFTMLFLAGLAGYGFHTALAGRRVFSERLLEIEGPGAVETTPPARD